MTKTNFFRKIQQEFDEISDDEDLHIDHEQIIINI